MGRSHLVCNHLSHGSQVHQPGRTLFTCLVVVVVVAVAVSWPWQIPLQQSTLVTLNKKTYNARLEDMHFKEVHRSSSLMIPLAISYTQHPALTHNPPTTNQHERHHFTSLRITVQLKIRPCCDCHVNSAKMTNLQPVDSSKSSNILRAKQRLMDRCWVLSRYPPQHNISQRPDLPSLVWLNSMGRHSRMKRLNCKVVVCSSSLWFFVAYGVGEALRTLAQPSSHFMVMTN